MSALLQVGCVEGVIMGGFILSRGATAEDVDGTLVVLGANGDAAVLNAVAGEVFEGVLANGVDETVRSMTERYDADFETIEHDVAEVIRDLKEFGMLLEATSMGDVRLPQ